MSFDFWPPDFFFEIYDHVTSNCSNLDFGPVRTTRTKVERRSLKILIRTFYDNSSNLDLGRPFIVRSSNQTKMHNSNRLTEDENLSSNIWNHVIINFGERWADQKQNGKHMRNMDHVTWLPPSNASLAQNTYPSAVQHSSRVCCIRKFV